MAMIILRRALAYGPRIFQPPDSWELRVEAVLASSEIPPIPPAAPLKG